VGFGDFGGHDPSVGMCEGHWTGKWFKRVSGGRETCHKGALWREFGKPENQSWGKDFDRGKPTDGGVACGRVSVGHKSRGQKNAEGERTKGVRVFIQ